MVDEGRELSLGDCHNHRLHLRMQTLERDIHFNILTNTSQFWTNNFWNYDFVDTFSGKIVDEGREVSLGDCSITDCIFGCRLWREIYILTFWQIPSQFWTNNFWNYDFVDTLSGKIVDEGREVSLGDCSITGCIIGERHGRCSANDQKPIKDKKNWMSIFLQSFWTILMYLHIFTEDYPCKLMQPCQNSIHP